MALFCEFHGLGRGQKAADVANLGCSEKPREPPWPGRATTPSVSSPPARRPLRDSSPRVRTSFRLSSCDGSRPARGPRRPRQEVQVALRAPRSAGATGVGAATRSGPGSFTGSMAPNTTAASTTRLGRRNQSNPDPTPFSWVWVSLRVMRLVRAISGRCRQDRLPIWQVWVRSRGFSFAPRTFWVHAVSVRVRSKSMNRAPHDCTHPATTLRWLAASPLSSELPKNRGPRIRTLIRRREFRDYSHRFFGTGIGRPNRAATRAGSPSVGIGTSPKPGGAGSIPGRPSGSGCCGPASSRDGRRATCDDRDGPSVIESRASRQEPLAECGKIATLDGK
jgi:hypothetical protein